MSTWAILCPGKSLESYVSDPYAIIYDADHVIAVNYAILFAFITPAYWAMMDGEVFKECGDRMDLAHFSKTAKTALWTPGNFENSSRTAEWQHRDAEAYRAFSKLAWQHLERVLPHPLTGEALPWNGSTLFTAIGLAVLMGAGTINVYGADFSGQGYFLPGLGNFRTDHRPPRWQRERAEFYRIQDALLQHDITLMRHMERT